MAEPDDIILFEPAIPVKGFILGNEVLVGASGYRARDSARIHLRARVEHVRQILYADAVTHFETGGRAISLLGCFRSLLILHGGSLPPKSFSLSRCTESQFFSLSSRPPAQSHPP